MSFLDKVKGMFGGAPAASQTEKKAPAPATTKSEGVKVAKPKIAYVHLSGCTGCLVSLADTYEKLLDILGAVDMVYNLTLADARTLPEGKIDISIVEGAVCLQDKESVHLIKEAREKSGLVIALGGCSSTGCVCNYSRGGQANQPQMESFVPINKLVKVDAYIPGCPPAPEVIYNFCIAAVTGDTQYLAPFMAQNVGGYHCGCDLQTQVVQNSLCMGCGTCASSCPTRAIDMEFGRPSFNQIRCVKCGACSAACPRMFLPVAEIQKKLMV
jgi:coenzyme F420 hydrogenase subunit gamma